MKEEKTAINPNSFAFTQSISILRDNRFFKIFLEKPVLKMSLIDPSSLGAQKKNRSAFADLFHLRRELADKAIQCAVDERDVCLNKGDQQRLAFLSCLVLPLLTSFLDERVERATATGWTSNKIKELHNKALKNPDVKLCYMRLTKSKTLETPFDHILSTFIPAEDLARLKDQTQKCRDVRKEYVSTLLVGRMVQNENFRVFGVNEETAPAPSKSAQPKIVSTSPAP